MEVNTSAFNRRDALIIISTAFVSAILLIGTSVWGTTIGTEMTVTTNLKATSTIQATGNIFGYADMFVGGTTSQALADVAIGGVAGTNADVFISGGLGVANATTSDGDFIVGDGSSGFKVLSFTKNGLLVVGATSTALSSTGAPNKFVFDGGEMMVSSGGTGTTTLSIVNEAVANGANACIEMSADGVTYRVFINNVRTGLLVELGSCMNQ